MADGNHLSSECRLALANAVSACYLSNAEGMNPSQEQLARFIENVDWAV
jgi:hypothetical protein